MNNFYVYAYIRCKSSNVASAGTPYYIGKGLKKRRFEKHGVPVPAPNYNVILSEGLTEVGAFALERWLIRWYGRQDLGTGILQNKTDGGDGGSGRKDSSETVSKRAKSNTGKVRSESARRNMSNAQQKVNRKGSLNPFFGCYHSEQTKTMMSLKKKGKSYNEIMGDEKAQEMRLRRSREQLGRKRGSQEKIACPHCGQSGGKGIMKRWHFENCKLSESHKIGKLNQHGN